jgi:hypothetical protein
LSDEARHERFVVRHQHPAGRCPAADFTAGTSLLNHLSYPSAARHGVGGEAVLAAHPGDDRRG